MSLNASTMAEEIVEQLEAISAPITDRPRVLAYWTAICTGIIIRVRADIAVHSVGADPQGGTVNSDSTVVT